ncbi:hypothetical protein C0995_007379 [Termitomyces sp. Mi166|nr:hypothetical protein C0995_007379 [Termitomyces sp. Mi166\
MHIIYQDLGDVPMPPANNDWEDVIADLAGPEMQGAEDMQDIIHDLRDIATSRWVGARHYTDHQTWKLHRE